MTVAATAATAATASNAGSSAVTKLAGNFNDFLKLLMTQLKNQDPTSPMDTNQFTSQLVQFASVEQQIDTNTSLTKLIEATQGNTLLQSSALVGHTVEATSDQLSLQGGQAALRFQSAGAQDVSISVFSSSGAKLRDASVSAASGSNTWSWDGLDASGSRVSDGAYKAVVTGADGTAVPFTILAKATGVQKVDGAMKVKLGTLQVDFGSIQSVGG